MEPDLSKAAATKKLCNDPVCRCVPGNVKIGWNFKAKNNFNLHINTTEAMEYAAWVLQIPLIFENFAFIFTLCYKIFLRISVTTADAMELISKYTATLINKKKTSAVFNI